MFQKATPQILTPEVNKVPGGQDDLMIETSPLLKNVRADTQRQCEDGEKQDGDREDPNPNPKLAMLLISALTTLLIIADRVAEPVLEQYVYQVYTKRVYGNASAGVHITRHPCINATNTSDPSLQGDTRRDKVQDKSADFLMDLEMIAFSIGAVSSLLLGTYSDVLGRRFLLVVPLVGHFLRDVMLPVVIHFDLGLTVLYAGYTLYGLGGSLAAILLGSYVYSTDVFVTERDRIRGLSMVMAAQGVGTAIIQYASGVFIQRTGFFFPSLTSAGCDVMALVIAVFFLPETVSRDKKQRITPADSVRRIVAVFLSSHNPRQKTVFLILLFIFFIGVFGDYPSMKLDILFLMNKPFCWSSSQMGLVMSIKYGVSRFTSLLLLFPLQKVLDGPGLVILGASSFCVANVVYGLASSELEIYIGAICILPCMIMFSGVRGMMSRMVPRDRQGALFGGIAVGESVCFGMSQVVFLSIYKAVINIKPGITYCAIAFCFFIDVVLCLVYKCLMARKQHLTVENAAGIQTEVPESPARTQGQRT